MDFYGKVGRELEIRSMIFPFFSAAMQKNVINYFLTSNDQNIIQNYNFDSDHSQIKVKIKL